MLNIPLGGLPQLESFPSGAHWAAVVDDAPSKQECTTIDTVHLISISDIYPVIAQAPVPD